MSKYNLKKKSGWLIDLLEKNVGIVDLCHAPTRFDLFRLLFYSFTKSRKSNWVVLSLRPTTYLTFVFFYIICSFHGSTTLSSYGMKNSLEIWVWHPQKKYLRTDLDFLGGISYLLLGKYLATWDKSKNQNCPFWNPFINFF